MFRKVFAKPAQIIAMSARARACPIAAPIMSVHSSAIVRCEARKEAFQFQDFSAPVVEKPVEPEQFEAVPEPVQSPVVEEPVEVSPEAVEATPEPVESPVAEATSQPETPAEPVTEEKAEDPIILSIRAELESFKLKLVSSLLKVASKFATQVPVQSPKPKRVKVQKPSKKDTKAKKAVKAKPSKASKSKKTAKKSKK